MQLETKVEFCRPQLVSDKIVIGKVYARLKDYGRAVANYALKLVFMYKRNV